MINEQRDEPRRQPKTDVRSNLIFCMRQKLVSSNAIFVSGLSFAVFAFLVYLAEVQPPEKMLSVTGPITELTPVYSERGGTRFRFCMGDPVLTFTYSGRELERAWSALNSARQASVVYAPGSRRTLWQLEVPGSFLVTTAELRYARMQHLLLLLAGLILSGAVATNGIVQALKMRATTSR